MSYARKLTPEEAGMLADAWVRAYFQLRSEFQNAADDMLMWLGMQIIIMLTQKWLLFFRLLRH